MSGEAKWGRRGGGWGEKRSEEAKRREKGGGEDMGVKMDMGEKRKWGGG